MSKRRYRMYSDEFERNALELAETSDKSDAPLLLASPCTVER